MLSLEMVRCGIAGMDPALVRNSMPLPLSASARLPPSINALEPIANFNHLRVQLSTIPRYFVISAFLSV